MTKNKSLRVFIGCLFVVFLFTDENVYSQKFKKRLSLRISTGTMYDDNILKYSEKYIEKFLKSEDEGRFSIKTYDDVAVKNRLSASYYFRIFNKKKTKISGNFSHNYYINNDIKSFNIYSIGVQQYFLKKASFKLSYSYIPEFYVRNFRDEDLVSLYGYTPEAFSPYIFSKDNYSFYVQNTFLKNLYVNLSASMANYYHNIHYTEYDSDNYSLGLRLQKSVTKKTRLGFGYKYTNSDAKGYDEVFETVETSEESDGSYDDHQFEVSLKSKLPRLMKHNNDFSLKLRFSKRNFLSEKLIEIDPLHASRVDNVYYVSLQYNFKYYKSNVVSLYYNRYQRDTDNFTDNYYELLNEEKAYRQNQVGFQISYALF